MTTALLTCSRVGVVLRWRRAKEKAGQALRPISGSLGPDLGLGGPARAEARSAGGGDAEDAGDSGDGGRLVAAWQRASRARSGPGRTLSGLVCPVGALRVRWTRLDLTGTGVLCSRVRSTTALGGGGCSLPRGGVSADHGSFLSSLPSCRPRGGYFGEAAMAASGSVWRMLVGG